MKLASILVLCLAVSIHQATAKPFIFDAIGDGVRSVGSIAEGIADSAGSVASGAAETAGSIASGIAQGASGVAQGAIGTATGIAKGFIGAGTSIAAGLADKAASVVKTISEQVQNVQNKVLKSALQQAQNTLQKVQDNARSTLQASEIAAKHAEEGIIEIEDKKNELIQEWADKAKAKLVNASPETQEKGQDLINGFVDRRSEAIKQASDTVLETLESLQERANATAAKYHEPMNKLIEQVGKCSEIKASQVRQLVKCAAEVRKDLEPLASAPGALAAVKAQLARVSGQNIIKNIKIQQALNQFRDQSKQVEVILDQLVAQDQKNQERNPAEDDGSSDEDQEDGDVVPEKDEQSEDAGADEEAQE